MEVAQNEVNQLQEEFKARQKVNDDESDNSEAENNEVGATCRRNHDDQLSNSVVRTWEKEDIQPTTFQTTKGTEGPKWSRVIRRITMAEGLASAMQICDWQWGSMAIRCSVPAAVT